MSKKLKTLPKLAVCGPKRKYPWDDWLGSGEPVIIEPKDYTCTRPTMVTNIRDMATKMGLRVSIRSAADNPNQIIIIPQGKI